MPGDQAESQKGLQQATQEFLSEDSAAFDPAAVSYFDSARMPLADIGAQRQAQEAQKLLAAIIASSDDAIISKTLDGIITSWNKAATNLFGYSAEEAIGQHITLIIPMHLRHEEDEIIARLRQGIHIDHYETVRVTKDGRYIDVSLSISPIKDEQGKVIGAAKIARDITRQKAMTRKLQEAEEHNARLYNEVQQARNQLEVILQGVADGIIVYGRDSKIIYANEAAARMTGYTSVQDLQQARPLEPTRRFEITDEKGKPFPLDQLTHRRVLAGEREAQAIIGYTRQVGGRPERWSIVKSSPVYDEHGEVLFIITITHDITERVLTEHRKDEFISMASHELKTPVTSLKGFTYVLQRRLRRQGDEQGLHYLERMDAQLDKLTKLVSDLLDISRIQMGKLEFQRAAFDLDPFIAETVENVQAATPTHRIRIHGKAEAQVFGDRDRLGQVLINLLTNAIKYSPQTDRVVVQVSRDAEWAIVRVQDFGIGIDEAHQQKIFERFYQVTDPEEKTYPGLGIGLHISKEIVELHQGRIEVHSYKGQGATFSVFLPVLQEGS